MSREYSAMYRVDCPGSSVERASSTQAVADSSFSGYAFVFEPYDSYLIFHFLLEEYHPHGGGKTKIVLDKTNCSFDITNYYKNIMFR